jgi:sigma-B regulation protein RsbU (phosphoserine phosphatase)
MAVMEGAIRERMLLLYDMMHLRDDAFAADELGRTFAEHARGFIAARERLEALGLTPAQAAELNRQREALRQAQTLLDGVRAQAEAGDIEQAASNMRLARQANAAVLTQLRAMRDVQQALTESGLEEAALAQRASRQQIATLAAAALALSLLVIGFVVRHMLRQDRALAAALGALEQTNQHLEQRVEERTRELLTAREENLRLGAEIETSRRIQTMLLPRPSELAAIRDLDIAGFMEPADEVGGDYYDVLSHGHHVIMGMGDVTGHGLESGVVMLMVQTALRTLTEKGGLDLCDTLGVINQVIYQNTQRMSSGKHLSLALLHYADGQLQIAGQHEELLLLRGGGVTRIDTKELGFPIGLEPEIRPFVTLYETVLAPGETAVLYTDGITEAEDSERRLYGLERLCAVLARVQDQPAADIVAAVIRDVRAHIGAGRLLDDISLLVMRRH